MKFQIIAGELCLDFINTLDNRPTPERRKELLNSYQGLVEWAAQAGAIATGLRARLLREAEKHPNDAEQALEKAIALRECLFRIMSAALKNRVSSGDLKTLSIHLSEALSHLELKAGKREFRLAWGEDDARLDSILWLIARSASDLLTSADLKHVRECGVNTCRWMFVDRSKNHSRRWCDMKVCGNRVKARKFYRRQISGGRSQQSRV